MARIKLAQDYNGSRSEGRTIAAGVWDAADEGLFGLADFLVETGYAVYTDVAVTQNPTPENSENHPSAPFLAHQEAMLRLGRPLRNPADMVRAIDGTMVYPDQLADRNADLIETATVYEAQVEAHEDERMEAEAAVQVSVEPAADSWSVTYDADAEDGDDSSKKKKNR